MPIPPVFATKQAQVDAGNVKSILTSTTLWGAILGLLSTLFPSIYTKLGLTDANQIAVIQQIVAGVSGIIVIYGRFTATQVVTISGK